MYYMHTSFKELLMRHVFFRISQKKQLQKSPKQKKKRPPGFSLKQARHFGGTIPSLAPPVASSMLVDPTRTLLEHSVPGRHQTEVLAIHVEVNEQILRF